ncbi:uncharacterized protein TNCV_1905391 [Trichonephila clavipes]|nr:uncharacterized protein TNCV_1905391 [Trichonephila clavipes]
MSNTRSKKDLSQSYEQQKALIHLQLMCSSLAERLVSEWLNINVELFSYSRAFGDGRCNFKPWLNDEDDTRDRITSPNFHTTPTVGYDRPRSGRPSTRRNAAETVKDEMETVAGSVSARSVARRTGIPYTTVWLALRRTLRCYPYKIHRHHELLPGDSVNRRAFAVWAFQKMAEDDDWLSNLLWTDAHFTLRGSVNTHNFRIWATENPRTVVETPLHDEKVTVWVGFTTSTVIGLFFFEEMRDSGFVTATVTGERYTDMLQNRIIPSLADKHLLERTIFMQDGAPPHIARRVKDLLRKSFGDDRVLSRHFHHAWPPRSPDLSPCDYWLWGYLKS